MALKDAGVVKKIAITNINVSPVEKGATGNHNVKLKQIRNVKYGMTPSYLWYNLWDPTVDFSCCTTDWTITAPPLIHPPSSEFENKQAMKTLNKNQIFLKIIMPIHCQGFTGRTPTQVWDGSLPKRLNEYPVQPPRLRQLRTHVGSKSLIMQDC